MKKEFKVGDIVRRIIVRGHDKIMPIGFEGKIIKIIHNGATLYFKHSTLGWASEYYELVTPKEEINNNYEKN